MSYPSDPAFSHAPTPPPYGGPPPGIQLAHWGLRVVATLIDVIPAWVVVTIGIILDGPRTNADGTTSGMGGVYVTCLLLGTAWVLYMSYLTGSRGQSIGKRVINIKVVKEIDGQVIGGGLGIARYFIHIVDLLPCGLGYLWPLWDSKRQTFTDKIMGTLAIKV
ncbi:MAG TPA: RDD family protein [Actinomycetes bacterium]|nr:RDD family protein [Actinomycetes bacterium]